MRHTKVHTATARHQRRLSFRDFIRWAALMTLGVTVTFLVIAIFQRNVEVWANAPLLWLLTIVAVWVGTLTVGWLVMFPLWIWRLSKRLAQMDTAKTIPQGQLWDRWMDGPEPI